MKRRIISLFILLQAVLTGCSAGAGGSGYTSVSMDEALSLMEGEKGYLILDVRTQEEYRQGHIPGAVCVPNETIGDEPPSALPDQKQKIYVYCRSGNRSRQAAAKLSALGYTDIIEFGGIIDYPGETVSGAE